MSPELRKMIHEAIGGLSAPGAAGNSALVKHAQALDLMKSIEAPLVVTDPEPDSDRHPAAHAQWAEKRQRAEFSHYVKALHARGPNETHDPRSFGGMPAAAAYQHHA